MKPCNIFTIQNGHHKNPSETAKPHEASIKSYKIMKLKKHLTSSVVSNQMTTTNLLTLSLLIRMHMNIIQYWDHFHFSRK